MANPNPAQAVLEAHSRRLGGQISDALRDVVVRTQPDGASAGLGAQAYAQGSDVQFAPGTYNPSSAQGRHLAAHELTHVVQQRAGQ